MKKIIVTCMLLVFIGVMNATAQKNTFTHEVGDYEVILIVEGINPVKTNNFIGARSEVLEKYFPENYYMGINAYLIKMGDKNILVDTGVGRNVVNNLMSIGVEPEDIDMLVLTHLHGDHIGGMTVDKKAVFPNAIVYVSDKEFRHWDSKNNLDALKPYSDRLKVVTPEKLNRKKEDGIYFIEAYGHTPGHMMCLVKSGRKQLLICGDLLHVIPVQIPHPEISLVYDMSPAFAVSTRRAVLEYVSKNKIPIAGMHIPYPGMGTVKKSKDTYKFKFLKK
ncbi:MBL fold metallo-hydrolase [Bacteroides sp. OttesenSCG-928-D19]|nr:MBL fold metallo-hydrolase [Bacteroides sp. OttesenSCG-928-D19]